MKKITYLLALFLVAQTSLFSQTPVPDVNFEQALIDFALDGVLNGMIDDDTAAASQTGTLNLPNYTNADTSVNAGRITDFTGIEAFTGFTGLNLNYNDMATVLDLSANLAIQTLTLEGCASLSTITMPGAGSQLVIFLAPDAALTALDLSDNVLLGSLNVRANQLTALDLSANTALTILDCNNQGGDATSLTSLDMRNGNNANVTSFNSDSNNNLTCIFVDDASEPNLGTWSIDSNSNFVEDQGQCDLLGTDDKTLTAFSMYPNPARSSFSILSKTQSSKLDVYSITGKLVLTKELSFGENEVGITSLSSGVYLARFTSENRSETKKLIVVN